MKRRSMVWRAWAAVCAASLGGGAASGQVCPGSEPSTTANFCDMARVLSGAPGMQVVVMNTAAATAGSETACGVNLGHTVWFSVVPSVSGIFTFTTCHPATTYDTVADAFAGGDGMCEFWTPVMCNDDTSAPECANGCSAFGSTLRFRVTAGTLYRLRVGSYNNNAAGCNLCLGVRATLCDGETTPPTVSITSPTPQSCVCAPSVGITGTVSDSGSGVASYTLDYAPVSGGAWTTIARGMGNVAGTLGTWSIGALGDQDYYLRLSAVDGCGNASSAVVTVRTDNWMDSVMLRWPVGGEVLGGTVVVDGTVWDHCPPGEMSAAWSPATATPTWTPFTTLLAPWILNDPIGTWNTQQVADGYYLVRLTGMTECGAAQYDMSNAITVDNTAPIAVITAPANCARLSRGVVEIRGTAADANLASWRLEYTGGGRNYWTPVASGTAPVVNGVLANWNTASLPWCDYTLRLVVTDAAVIDSNPAVHNVSEYQTTFAIGCIADANGNQAVSVQDIFDFLTAYFGGCP